MRDKLPVTNKLLLDKITSYTSKSQVGLENIGLSVIIRMIRKRLRMTQSQLARRTGMPQSYIANIEKREKNIRLNTARKIFDALYCKTLVLPKTHENLDHIVERKIRELAKRKVSRVTGTMLLEDQRPHNKTIQDLIRKEESNLRINASSEIWE